eukprot:COSAG02_NODE_1434_length_12632_cov_16.006144_3_plen_55_part_00
MASSVAHSGGQVLDEVVLTAMRPSPCPNGLAQRLTGWLRSVLVSMILREFKRRY